MTALARSLKFHTESKGKARLRNGSCGSLRDSELPGLLQVKGTPHPLDKLMQDASVGQAFVCAEAEASCVVRRPCPRQK